MNTYKSSELKHVESTLAEKTPRAEGIQQAMIPIVGRQKGMAFSLGDEALASRVKSALANCRA
jgi:hypothetical protein